MIARLPFYTPPVPRDWERSDAGLYLPSRRIRHRPPQPCYSPFLPLQANAAFVQQGSGLATTLGTTVALSGALVPTTGNHIFIVVLYVTAAGSRTVTYNNVWGTVVEIGTPFYTSPIGVRIARVENCNNTSSTASITMSGNCDDIGYLVIESSGVATSGADNGASVVRLQTNPGTGAGAISQSVTPSTQPAIVYGFSWAQNSASWDTAVSDTGLTRVWNNSGKPQWARVTSTSAKTETWTTNVANDNYYTVLASFKEAAGAAAQQQMLTLLGVGC